MPGTASLAEFARRHGVSKPAVSKWRRDGHIVLIDGAVDVDASDARLRGAGLGKFKAASTARRARHDAAQMAEEAAEPIAAPDIDGEAFTAFLEGLAASHFAAKAEAERVKENALAGLRVLELRQKSGALVELELAEAAFFNQARAFRDAWLNWPARIGPRLAAEFDLPADKLTEALARYVNAELASLGEPHPDFSTSAG